MMSPFILCMASTRTIGIDFNFRYIKFEINGEALVLSSSPRFNNYIYIMYNFNAIEVKIGILQLLENNNIPLPEYTRKNDEGSSFGNKDKCHALVVGSSRYSSFIIDLGASRPMD